MVGELRISLTSAEMRGFGLPQTLPNPSFFDDSKAL